jgi:hypothetical protein
MPHPVGEEQHGEPLKDPPVRNNKSVDRGQRLKWQSEKNASKKKTKKKKWMEFLDDLKQLLKNGEPYTV